MSEVKVMTATEAVNEMLKALELQLIWHEEREKSLSKQPPSSVNQWERLQHREQADLISAAIVKASGAYL